ncbi:hypothetical protein scyTo_0010984 [Scyliorhinus torazame]|uniref:MRH domain-containing protein n=1 Tax=Scyliorhinus torazame TaxID=75743 RepID=A0A401PDV7_SCYTO|nr:hypothetical protein [Scyliorhinus torazame]
MALVTNPADTTRRRFRFPNLDIAPRERRMGTLQLSVRLRPFHFFAEHVPVPGAAEKARNEFSEAEKSLKEVESLIGSIEKELTIDFGADGEFAYMFSQCYEMTTNEYVYKLCPFNKVAQKPKNGGSETSLGLWGSWAGPENNRFSAMKYEHGTGCWQGPSRSTLVKLSCGKETARRGGRRPRRAVRVGQVGLNRLLESPCEEANARSFLGPASTKLKRGSDSLSLLHYDDEIALLKENSVLFGK